MIEKALHVEGFFVCYLARIEKMEYTCPNDRKEL